MGYLSTCNPPAQPEGIPLGSILLADQYYYDLEEGAEAADYPICASFETRGHAHHDLPDVWKTIVKMFLVGRILSVS